MVQWVIDSHDIAQFVTQGHHDQFHINPEQDLIIRMKANGFSNSEIQAAINNGAVAADWMQPELIASVIARMTRWVNILRHTIQVLLLRRYGYTACSDKSLVEILFNDMAIPLSKPLFHMLELLVRRANRSS